VDHPNEPTRPERTYYASSLLSMIAAPFAGRRDGSLSLQDGNSPSALCTRHALQSEWPRHAALIRCLPSDSLFRICFHYFRR
jgi:hypothetical protein